MSIREKVCCALGLLILLSCAVGGIAVGRFDALGAISREITAKWMPSIQAVGRVSLLTQRHRALVILHILNTEEARIAEIDRDLVEATAQVESARGEYQRLISLEEERKTYEEFSRNWAEYMSHVEAMLVRSRKNENAEAAELMQRIAWPIFTRSRQALDRLVEMNAAGGQQASAVAVRLETSGKVLILSVLGFCVVVSVGAGLWIVRGVSRDISALAGPMDKLAAGDLAVAVPKLPARTEIGRMALAVDRFAIAMREAEELRASQESAKQRAEQERKAALAAMANTLEQEVGVVVEGIASASTELTAAADSMVTVASDTTARAATVSAASAAANGDVNAVAAATEELAASVAEISRQIAESAGMAAGAVEQSSRADTTVANLNAAAATIGEVTHLIGSIAAQTNLLALNATIEAARAGDAGKGFAVVASEVKALASQTAQATQSIARQIAAMQSATQDATSDLGAIRQTIGRISEVTAAVAAAVKEQGAATRDIAQNVQRAAIGTSDIAGAIDGVTMAAGETGGAANQVQATAVSLSSQAELVRRQVGDFLRQVRAA